MVSEMIYRFDRELIKNFNINDEVWAIYVDRCSGKSGRIHNKPPMLGKLIGYSEDSKDFYWFVPYKVRNGQTTNELDIKSKIWIGKLTFSDTYEELVVEYNKFINYEIEFHEKKLESLRKCIITLNKGDEE